MKCVCISCFDHYPTRFKFITEFFRQSGYETYYIISDYLHFEKKHSKVEHPDVIHIHVPGYKKNMSPVRLYSHCVFANGVYRKLEIIKPDVIYCMFPPNMLVKKCAQYKDRHPEVKLIFDCYDSWPESMPVKSSLLNVPFSIWRNLRDKYLESADKAICVSELGKEWLSKLHPNLSIGVLYPRLDNRAEISYCSDVSDSIKFCYLGNINYITDVDLMVSLLAAICSKKKVILHHVGGGQNLIELEDKLNKVGVEFILHGSIFDIEKKEEIFSRCNLGLNLPRKEINSSMSLKSVEYMRAGIPFVNSGTGDNWNIVEKWGIGINCTRDNFQNATETLINLQSTECQKMHEKIKVLYKSMFSSPDYNFIFKNVL